MIIRPHQSRISVFVGPWWLRSFCGLRSFSAICYTRDNGHWLQPVLQGRAESKPLSPTERIRNRGGSPLLSSFFRSCFPFAKVSCQVGRPRCLRWHDSRSCPFPMLRPPCPQKRVSQLPVTVKETQSFPHLSLFQRICDFPIPCPCLHYLRVRPHELNRIVYKMGHFHGPTPNGLRGLVHLACLAVQPFLNGNRQHHLCSDGPQRVGFARHVGIIGRKLF